MLHFSERQDAQDAFQNTFLKYALADGARFENEEHRKAWLVRTASNACKDILRASARRTARQTDADRLAAVASADPSSQPGCEGSCHRADAEAREDAHHAGMGVGKYRAAQQLMELDDSVTLDDCAGMTMRELHDRIDACADGAESGRGEHGAHSGAGQGTGKEAGGTNAGAGSHGHHGSDE